MGITDKAFARWKQVRDAFNWRFGMDNGEVPIVVIDNPPPYGECYISSEFEKAVEACGHARKEECLEYIPHRYEGTKTYDSDDELEVAAKVEPTVTRGPSYRCGCGTDLQDLQPDEKSCWKCGSAIVH